MLTGLSSISGFSNCFSDLKVLGILLASLGFFITLDAKSSLSK